MKNLIKVLAISLGLFLLLSPSDSYGQQDAEYTQYMFNSLVLNPAYTGSRGVISTNALYRNQWTGIDGAPETVSFSIHGPLRDSNSALGLWIENDEIGAHKQLRLYGSYAYHIPMDNGAKLSLGLQAGIRNFSFDIAGNGSLLGDQQFVQVANAGNQLLPNIGAGAWYYTKTFYAGISAPHLLQSYIYEDGGTDFYREINHYFLTAGVVLPLTDNVKFKPTALLKIVKNAPVELDLTAHFLINEMLWLGAAWRSNDSIDFLGEIQLSPQLRAGYAYDLTTSELRNHTSGTHEVMLGYDFCFKRNQIVTPRYF